MFSIIEHLVTPRPSVAKDPVLGQIHYKAACSIVNSFLKGHRPAGISEMQRYAAALYTALIESPNPTEFDYRQWDGDFPLLPIDLDCSEDTMCSLLPYIVAIDERIQKKPEIGKALPDDVRTIIGEFFNTPLKDMLTDYPPVVLGRSAIHIMTDELVKAIDVLDKAEISVVEEFFSRGRIRDRDDSRSRTGNRTSSSRARAGRERDEDTLRELDRLLDRIEIIDALEVIDEYTRGRLDTEYAAYQNRTGATR